MRTSQQALGIIGMLCAPAMFVAIAFFPPFSTAENALGLVYLVGFLASVVGLRLSRATGHGKAAIVVLAVHLVGLALAWSQNTLDLLGRGKDTVLYTVADISWPVSHVFMLVVGGLVLKARVWTGACRFTPLACGLVLPLAMAVGGVAGYPVLRFTYGVLSALAFLALGNCVRQSSVGSPKPG